MNEHPIEGLMLTAMNSIRDMVDVNTIIGEPIETSNNVVIIPISKVSFGFAAGGSEFKGETVDEYTKKDKEEEIQYRLPFGGGSGAGVSINPVAFLVVQEGGVKLLPVDHSSAVDKLIDYVPDLIEKVTSMFQKQLKDKTEQIEKTNKLIEENMKNKKHFIDETKNEQEDIKQKSEIKHKQDRERREKLKDDVYEFEYDETGNDVINEEYDD